MADRHSVAVFVGTRPEVIKLAPVIAGLRTASDFTCRVVATGQHKEMFQQVARIFDLSIDADLSVMRPNQGLAGLTARLIEGIDGWLDAQRPDMALVQGDTTTVLAAGLACFYRGIPVGHVEAGLRTGDIRSPFPEEANRRLVAPLATLHFAPTAMARDALLREFIPPAAIVLTGNTVIDALRMEVARQQSDPVVRVGVESHIAGLLGPGWSGHPMVLITGHRRENFGYGLERICSAIERLAARYPSHLFVYPVHLNPNVVGPVERLLGHRANIRLVPPQDYRTFVALMRHCKLILTDSGGVQEEAPWLGKPVLVMRETTERPEGVAAGTAVLTGTDADCIVTHATRLLEDEAAYRRMATATNPYGDGRATERIMAAIRRHFADRAGDGPR